MKNYPCKVFKNICFWNKKIEKKLNCNSYGVMKYGQILTIENSLATKWLRFSKKRFMI
jgi:hypothetical protein